MASKITPWIILADNILNWFLGLVLTFFPGWMAGWLAPVSLVPGWLYLALGIGFIAFAAWQVVIFLRSWSLPATALRQAALLAWGPVVILTAVLLSPLAQSLYLLPRTLLWIGNGYMLVLGMWYWRVAKL